MSLKEKLPIPKCSVHDIYEITPEFLRSQGVELLLMDLDNIRRQNVEEDFLAYAVNNAGAISCGDQEIINEVCRGRIKILDERWNVQSSNFVNRSSYTSFPRIIHFVARKKPWHWASFSVHKDLFFKYLQMTPWKLDEAELYRWTVENKRASRWAYLKYRPFFWLRPRFYKALYLTISGTKNKEG